MQSKRTAVGDVRHKRNKEAVLIKLCSVRWNRSFQLARGLVTLKPSFLSMLVIPDQLCVRKCLKTYPACSSVVSKNRQMGEIHHNTGDFQDGQ